MIAGTGPVYGFDVVAECPHDAEACTRVLIIHPATGMVTGAYDAAGEHLFMTGKPWPRRFETRVRLPR